MPSCSIGAASTAHSTAVFFSVRMAVRLSKNNRQRETKSSSFTKESVLRVAVPQRIKGCNHSVPVPIAVPLLSSSSIRYCTQTSARLQVICQKRTAQGSLVKMLEGNGRRNGPLDPSIFTET